MLITIPLITYFGMAIGFERAVMTLFGISHVNVQESVISSNYAINFFLISLLPIMSFFVLQKKQYQSFKLFYPELIWLLTIAIFYFYYAGKRSFFVAYGSEFIPLLIIICLSVSTFPNTQKIKNYSGYLLLGILFCANLMLYVFIEGPRGDSPQIKKYSLDRLAGSGVPRKSFDAISRLIVLNAQPNDQLIAGNLEFAASIGLAQYLNITRPMAYEGRSKVYEMYQAPTKEEVLSKMKSEPPRFIIYDHHLELTFWNDIEQTLIPKYDLKYWDPYSRLFILRD